MSLDPRRIPLWCLFWLVVAGVSIFLHGPQPLYSTRTLSAAWEMWIRSDFLVPYLNGAPYSHKTPLLYWLIHAGWAITGPTDLWPRALEVLIGATTLALAGRLAGALHPERPLAARLAPWILAGGAYYFLFALQLMYEVLLTACVLGALVALARGERPGARPSWRGFAVAVALGLLTKGPVMLLHVAPALVAGPWWAAAARQDRTRWYRNGALALVAGAGLFALWVVPAVIFGGPEYRHMLLWTQTAGRVVQSFDHARPLWWYLVPVLPVLLFPWLYWRPAVAALATLRTTLDDGGRFCVVWLAGTFLVFSLVSGKQVYYLLPEFAGFAVLLAGTLAPRGDEDARPAWLIGLALLVLGLGLAFLPELLTRWPSKLIWLNDMAVAPRWYGVVTALVALALWRARPVSKQVIAIACAATLATAFAHAAFSVRGYRGFDLSAIATAIADAQRAGHPVAHVGTYEGQFQFLGRLTSPVQALPRDGVEAWAEAHPDGLLVEYPRGDLPTGDAGPLIAQPFRQRQVALWKASVWLAGKRAASGDDEP